ncbi:MAG: hypothetical protein ACK4YP_01915 [Myxococcota bacterium]
MDPRLNVLGIVWIAWSAVTALAGLFVLALALGLGGLIAGLPDHGTGEPAFWEGLLFGTFGAVLGAVIAGMGLFGCAVGQALRHGRTWALIASLVLGFLQLSNVPFGLALAIWTFVVVIPILGEKK